MYNNRKNLKAICPLMQKWKDTFGIEPELQEWLLGYARILRVRRGEILYDEAMPREQVFFVCSGLLARVWWHSMDGRRNIRVIAQAPMMLMGTYHLYTARPSYGQIIALRSGVVLCFSRNTLRQSKLPGGSLDIMFARLLSKEKMQQDKLTNARLIMDVFERYAFFRIHLPELSAILTLEEQAQLLDMSLSSVKRASKFLLTGKRR